MISNKIFQLNLIFLEPYLIILNYFKIQLKVIYFEINKYRINYCRNLQQKYDFIQILKFLIILIINTFLQLNIIFLNIYKLLLNYDKYLLLKYDLILLIQ